MVLRSTWYIWPPAFSTIPKLGLCNATGFPAFSRNKEEAIIRSYKNLSAMRAGLLGAYRQIRLEPLSTDVAQWLARSLSKCLTPLWLSDTLIRVRMPVETLYAGSTGIRQPGAQQYSLQQNELLFRGIDSLEEEFLLMLLASHVRLDDITRMLSGLLEDTSVYASRQLGTRAASFGVSLPAILTGGLAENASVLMAPIIPQELPRGSCYGWNGQLPGAGPHRGSRQHTRLRRISLAFPKLIPRVHLRQLVQQSATEPLILKEQR